MNIVIHPERKIPHDHLAWLMARHGWWRVAVAFTGLTLGRGAMAPVRRLRAPPPPRPADADNLSDHLRRDIGLGPYHSGPKYWDLR